eukprot:CAMPEP_0201884108 /NCGR_PEP_ID=MMETSP0902-20130614/16518_1 /ASSEMBLY_ACC=CAM_ASM_000551 /TAXON_ID=420261 /ORGANISM="Thalassiosira antarctica, Strain CCMP982" /LENGTH=47 /DNA_ID= /DNA_START= /DNA_END= /DNA_ORIENTATION=
MKLTSTFNTHLDPQAKKSNHVKVETLGGPMRYKCRAREQLAKSSVSE